MEFKKLSLFLVEMVDVLDNFYWVGYLVVDDLLLFYVLFSNLVVCVVGILSSSIYEKSIIIIE